MDRQYIFDNSTNIYMYGSYVYGTNTSKSDKDYIVVSDVIKDEHIQIGNEEFNIYSSEKFQEKLDKNEIDALECMFLDKKFILKEDIKFPFEINKEKLKESIGKTSSNSFVKCHKKLTVEKDYNPYIGKKSLWHSLRIVMFGTQIAKTGKIYDYAQANKYYNEIMQMPDFWENIKFAYQPVYNNLKSAWRLSLNKEYKEEDINR